MTVILLTEPLNDETLAHPGTLTKRLGGKILNLTRVFFFLSSDQRTKEEDINLLAMDNSHVALVAAKPLVTGFKLTCD